MRRRHLALAGTLSALVLPAMTADAAQACASSPYYTVQRYYQALDGGSYRTAWSCLSAGTQRSLGGYATWRSGYRTTTSTRLSSIAVQDGVSTFATIAVRLRSCRTSGGADLLERFSGTWDVRRRAGRWQMERPRLTRTASRRVNTC